MLRQFIRWLGPVVVLLALYACVRAGADVRWLVGIAFAWWLVGIAWQVTRARKIRPDDAGSPSAPAPLQEGSQFDPELFRRTLRIGAICLVAMVLLQFIFFLTVQSGKCPGWQAPAEKASGSVWIILVFATIWTIHISYRAMTWRRDARKIADQIEWARKTYVPSTNPTWLTDPTQFKAMCTLKNNMNAIIIAVLVGSGFFVALPALTRISCF
jgi:hypothetical protein